MFHRVSMDSKAAAMLTPVCYTGKCLHEVYNFFFFFFQTYLLSSYDSEKKNRNSSACSARVA